MTSEEEKIEEIPCESSSGNPINAGTGRKMQTVEVYRGGLFQLRYSAPTNSDPQAHRGLFSPGWSTLYDARIHSADDKGDAAGPSRVAVRKPTGQTIDFRRQTDGSYLADPDISDHLLRLTNAQGGTSGWRFRDRKAARMYIFESLANLWEARLTQVMEAGGQSYILNYGSAPQRHLLAITGPTTLLTFRFNSNKQVASTSSPFGGGEIVFSYDTSSRLGSITWPKYPTGSEIKTFLYEDARFPNHLTGIVDENLNRFATWSYDALGRAISSEHAGGVDRVQLAHFDNASVETDALGSVRVRHFAKTLGTTRLVASTQPSGSGCAAATSRQAYDARGNVISRDDFNGNRVCYAYDSLNRVVREVQGLSTSASCSTMLANAAVLPTGVRKIQTEWHADWNLITRRSEATKLSTYIFNGEPDRFAGGALASCAPPAAVLPDGKPIAVLCRSVEQATTDVNGAQEFLALLQPGALDREERWTFNARGQVVTHDGPRTDISDITSFSYYSNNGTSYLIGDLESITNASGHVTRYTQHNFSGQPLAIIDGAGITTVQTFDYRQRLLSRSVGGMTTSYTYDAVGNVKQIVLPDGSKVLLDYDAANRLVKSSDALGNSRTYILDNAGNRLSEQIKDPAGLLQRSIARSFDALGRLEKITGALK